MRRKARKVFGYTVVAGICIAMLVSVSVSTGIWWVGPVAFAGVALLAFAITCILS